MEGPLRGSGPANVRADAGVSRALVWGLGFVVCGLWFGAEGLGFRVDGLGFRV